MKMPVGKMVGQQIDDFLNESINYHMDTYIQKIAEYEPFQLYSNWRTLIRCIDEIINIPLELNAETERDEFLYLKFDFLNHNNLPSFKKVIEIIKAQFGNGVSERFTQMALMSSAINMSYQSLGVLDFMDGINLSSTVDSIIYFQSRRIYYLTTLNLIPQIARGTKKVPFIDLLNQFQYTIDSCLVGITTSYYKLLLNQCLTDYEMESDGKKAFGNFDFTHLEGFFMEPERLSLIDQMELRPDIVVSKELVSKSDKKVFSFSEILNTMSLFEGAFIKYKINTGIQFKEMNMFINDIKDYLIDDFNFEIEESIFLTISQKYKSLNLKLQTSDYFTALNSFAPFQKITNHYFSTVVLLTKFVYRTLSLSLLQNKTFQIQSGFIFEDKVSKMLEEYGYAPTNITRINHKEFDLITIRNNKVYNFQCKNNFIDISRVDYNYKLIGKFNRLLCRYYEKALLKEEQRENLILSKTGINEIEHFVISRYPVITRNCKIINFKDLEHWMKKGGI